MIGTRFSTITKYCDIQQSEGAEMLDKKGSRIHQKDLHKFPDESVKCINSYIYI